MATVGENIITLRKRRGWKQKDLAAHLTMHQGDLSNLENDKRGLPETPTLLRLSKALRCSVDDLLAGVDPDYDTVIQRRAVQVLPSSSTGGDDAATSARLLGERDTARATLRAVLTGVQHVTQTLIELLEHAEDIDAREQAAPPDRRPAKGRRSPRKTH